MSQDIYNNILSKHEPKTQRSVTMPDRLWDFVKNSPNVPYEISYNIGVRLIVETAYNEAKGNTHEANGNS